MQRPDINSIVVFLSFKLSRCVNNLQSKKSRNAKILHPQPNICSVYLHSIFLFGSVYLHSTMYFYLQLGSDETLHHKCKITPHRIKWSDASTPLPMRFDTVEKCIAYTPYISVTCMFPYPYVRSYRILPIMLQSVLSKQHFWLLTMCPLAHTNRSSSHLLFNAMSVCLRTFYLCNRRASVP